MDTKLLRNVTERVNSYTSVRGDLESVVQTLEQEEAQAAQRIRSLVSAGINKNRERILEVLQSYSFRLSLESLTELRTNIIQMRQKYEAADRDILEDMEIVSLEHDSEQLEGIRQRFIGRLLPEAVQLLEREGINMQDSGIPNIRGITLRTPMTRKALERELAQIQTNLDSLITSWERFWKNFDAQKRQMRRTNTAIQNVSLWADTEQ